MTIASSIFLSGQREEMQVLYALPLHFFFKLGMREREQSKIGGTVA